MTPMIARIAALSAALLLPPASFAADTPENFVAWRPGLASSAQPPAAWLERARDLGYDVVVNLAPPQSQGSIANEGALVASRGITYVNIPVNFMKPSAEDFRFFSAVLRANAGRNVLVHCQVNLRGSSFTFLYRVIEEGASGDEAAAKLTAVWSPDAVWKRFIEETLAAHGRKAEIF